MNVHCQVLTSLAKNSDTLFESVPVLTMVTFTN